MSELKWNKKASTYSRYSEDNNSFEANVLKDVKNFGVFFKNKRVLDVGCGTGIYTIHVAKEATYIDALDFAKEMLDVLENDALSLHVDNINTICGDWESFTCKAFYDVTISTMSPALTKEKAYEKFDKCAKTKVYLGWNGKRESSIMNPLFELFGKKYHAPKGACELQKWLEINKKNYFSKEYTEKRSSSKNFEDMYENVSWHLSMNEVQFNQTKVKEFLRSKIEKDGLITNNIYSGMKLLIWE